MVDYVLPIAESLMQPMIQNYYLFNHELRPLSSQNDIILQGEVNLYEVIRVMDGISLFLEDHLERLYHSASLLNLKIPYTENELVKLLKSLILINKSPEGNIRIDLYFESGATVLVAGYVPHSYPSAEEYSKGVVVDFFYATRENPNAKVWHQSMREQIKSSMHEKKLFELLLVDPDGFVTEGSRSNFFVFDGEMWLTPPGNQVLQGITRKYILSILKRKSIPFLEQPIKIADLQKMKALVITGTSPKIIPARKAGNILFDLPKPEVSKLMNLFNQFLEEWIVKYKSGVTDFE